MDNEVIQLTKEDLEQAITKATLDLYREMNKDKNQSEFYDTKPNGDKLFADLITGIKNNDRDLIKAANPMTEGTPADGGYLVPSITQAEILQLLETYGQGRKLFQKYPLGQTGKVKLPAMGNDVVAYWVGENTQITTSKPTLSSIDLEAQKLVAIVLVSNELLEDAIVDLASYIKKRIAVAFGKKEDNAFFNNTTPFTGLFKVSPSNFGNFVNISSTDPTDLTYEHILDALYGLDQSLLTGAIWMMNRSWLKVIRGIKDTIGNPIFYPANDGNVGTLMGIPVALIEQAPVATTMTSGSIGIILGNPTNSLFGEHKQMRVELLRESFIDGTSLSQYDLTGIKVVERVAFNAGLTKGYSAIGYVST